MHLGWSSHAYPLDASDVAKAADYDGPAIASRDLPSDKIILLIRKGAPDALLRGRAALEESAAKGGSVDVRVVFVPTVAKWNIPFTVTRFLRNLRKFKSSATYHIDVAALRRMGLERAIRTLENPQLRMGKDRSGRMARLKESLLERGYDDSRPLTIMLCRTRGMEDSIRQGHHRISACIECGIPRATICFSAAGALPRFVTKLIGRPRKRPDVLQRALESACGKSVSRIVPLGDRPVPASFMVVPKEGGRFVLDLRGDDIPGLGGVAGLAPAILVPVMVAAAILVDVTLMRTAGGGHAFIVWCQTVLTAAIAALVAIPALYEKCARAGYLATSFVFLMMFLYGILHDVAGLDANAVGFPLAGLALVWTVIAARFRSFFRGVRRVALSRGFSAVPFGFVMIWLVSKAFGSSLIWGATGLPRHDVKYVKHLIQEGTELLGYAVMACWAILFLCDRIAIRRRRI